MEKNLQKHYELVKFMSRMPGKIVGLHGLENITEFVLHELASTHCFNFARAGYFVDNPDFNYFKGIAGYDVDHLFSKGQAIWEDPAIFSSHMEKVPFNKLVRTLERSSPKKGSICEKEFVDDVAHELQFKDPGYFCWRMKHDNHGLIVFEKVNGQTHWDSSDLENGAHLLSLCPVF